MGNSVEWVMSKEQWAMGKGQWAMEKREMGKGGSRQQAYGDWGHGHRGVTFFFYIPLAHEHWLRGNEQG